MTKTGVGPGGRGELGLIIETRENYTYIQEKNTIHISNANYTLYVSLLHPMGHMFVEPFKCSAHMEIMLDQLHMTQVYILHDLHQVYHQFNFDTPEIFQKGNDILA